MDEVEIIIPDQISDEFLLSRRESAERHEHEENQENINKAQLKYIKQLIKKVHQRRELYDINYKGFSKKEAKENAWQQIAKELGREVEECKISWVKVRYLYQKHVRKLRKFLQSGNKNRKRRPIMPFESDLIFLFKFIADRSGIPKRRVKQQPTTIIDCEDDDVVLLDDTNPIVVIDLDDNDSPTKTKPDLTSQLKSGKLYIGPDVVRFIDALKEYPELYDVDNCYYGDYRRKGAIWNALANELKEKATKLMKLWIYLQVRYEWEINNLTNSDNKSEMNKMLSFLKPYLLKNPKTVYKLSFYIKTIWQEPIEHFKNIFQLLAVIRKYPNVINFTDEYLLSNKDIDYNDVWFQISKARGVTAGQCEITWLIMRHFYWELMNMRKHTYQLQDKWYFEGIISELYLHAKPLDPNVSSATPATKDSDIYANSFAKSTPIPIDLEDNINATCIYNNPENSLYKTFTENSNPMFPKITSAKSLHVSAQHSFASLEKNSNLKAPYNNYTVVPATIKPTNLPIEIAVVSAPSTQLPPTVLNKNIPPALNRQAIPLKHKRLQELGSKPVTPLPLSLPPLTPISSPALNIPAPGSAASPLHVVSTVVQVPLQQGVSPQPLPSASTSLKAGISPPPVSVLNTVPNPSLNPSLITTPVRVLPLEPVSRAIISPVPPLNISSGPASPASVVSSIPKPAIAVETTTSQKLLPPPQPEQLQPPSDNLSPLPKITGALSLLNPNEIMIELVATPSGNQLLVHGPPLSAKYSLSMDTTAKFIREVMAIPRLHNKNIPPSATNLYWQYLSQKFSLPIHICKACWNFLADNFTHFNQIAPMEKLMKPFKTTFKVWKESTVLFRNFEALAVERNWLQYRNDLPMVMSDISEHPDILEIDSNKNGPVAARIISMYCRIRDLWDICIAFRNVFMSYMADLERGVDNKWPQAWWRVLMKLKFLLEIRYKNTEPFYYIVRNKINEEIIICAQNETINESEVELRMKTLPPVKLNDESECANKSSKKADPAPKIYQRKCVDKFIDPYKLMICIQRNASIYEKCYEWEKISAWKTIAKEMESNVKDCRILFTRLVKDYRNYVHRDPNGLCRINRNYFKPMKEIHLALQSRKKRNLSGLKFPADAESPPMEKKEEFIPNNFISELVMENSKPSLVMKNWVNAIGEITSNSQCPNKLEEELRTLFEKYRKYSA